MAVLRLSRLVLRLIVSLILALAILWAVAALWIDGPESRALAGVADGTLVFCLPGSTGACTLGMDKIILPQIDATTRPCNLVALLPRIRHE